ncbi:hypothetical protein EW026_g4412 [Hermanssonia centrifuga]|uniref:Uncharacterized protein n=1 Tax=Hermanssonia centrifuga TaxID=98765 RepID=A0A4S4KIY6_9APHY|nr:hypothetical protein EW026_g4412 [Hermanssonia centrifuga]
MDTILDSPISVTAQLVSSRSTTPADGDSAAASAYVDADFAMEEWRNEKSREELSDLLVVAGDIIKSRGTAVASRTPPPPPLPAYGTLDASPSPPGEIALLADQNAELLDKLEKLEEESAHADLAGKRKLRKLEREIQGLREELEKTQAKGVELEEKAKEVLAMSEDEVMKRKREEREEKMRALRESLKVASSDPSPSTIATLSLGEEVRDFAPGRELSRSTASSSSTKTSPSPISLALPLPTKVLSAPGTITSIPEEPGPSVSYFPRPDTQPQLQSQPPLEYAIISQLLSKIRELEETNAEISQEQKATAERLQAAQWDAESIRRAYDCLSDEAGGVHVIEDDDGDFADASDSFSDSVEYEPPLHMGTSSPGNTEKRIASGSTIRFSSLRRTIDGDISRVGLCEDLKDDFDLGISKDMQSTTRSVYSLHPKQQSGQQPHAASGKPRKSVMGLFDVDGDADTNARGPYPKTLSVSPAFRAAVVGRGTDLADMSTWSIAATDGFERTSPSPSPSLSPFPSPLRLSSLSPPASRSPSPSPSSSPLNLPIAPSPLFRSHTPSTLSSTSFFGSQRKPHTLGSELGSEFGDGEEEGGWNYHLRASSLYDLSGMVSGGGSVSGSSVPPSPGLERVGIPGGWDERDVDPGVEGGDDDRREGPGDGAVEAGSATASSVGGSATPTRSVLSGRGGGGLQLQFVVEPPTPSLGKSLRTSRSSHSLRSARSLGVGSSKTIGGEGRPGEAQERESRASRSARLSQTMKARTNRWVERVERRYAGEPEDNVFSSARSSAAAGVLRTRRSALNVGARGHPRRPRTSSALDETFDEVVHQFSRSVSATSLDFDFDDEERLLHQSARFGGARLETSPSAQVMYPTKREGFVGFVLEVLLWLQFGLVVMVFLWAMARRGPKSVLEDAERRKAAGGVKR